MGHAAHFLFWPRMSYFGVTDEITALTESIIAQLGFFLVDVEYQPEGGKKVLRLFIDKEGGRISLDDCETVSRAVEKLLANSELEARLLRDSYLLEVSSPGADRVLKKEREFIHFKGREVTLILKTPIDGQIRLEGILGEVSPEKLQLYLEGNRTLDVIRTQIKKVQLRLRI